MQPFQKMKDKDGNEVCLFPLPVLNITQVSSPDSFSHCCGHPIDCVGESEKANLYAPVSMRLIEIGNSGNGRGWQSINKVVTPNGLQFITIYLLHDENPPFSNIGDVVEQGEIIGHTGIAGYVTGDHSHIDQAFGENKKMISYGVTCSSGNECYALQDSVEPTLVFFINDTELINSHNLSFMKYNGENAPVENRSSFIFYSLRNRIKRM